MTVYQLRAEFELIKREGAIVEPEPPSFPYMGGWTFVGAVLEGQQTSLRFEGSEGVPKAMNTLFASLEEAAKRGEVKEKYDVKLFMDEPAVAASTAPAAPAAPASKAKKSRWAGLF